MLRTCTFFSIKWPSSSITSNRLRPKRLSSLTSSTSLPAWLDAHTAGTGYVSSLQKALQDYALVVANDQSKANGTKVEQEGAFAFASSWSGSYALLSQWLNASDLGLISYYSDPVAYVGQYLSGSGSMDSVHGAVAKSLLLDVRAMAKTANINLDDLPGIAYPAGPPLRYQKVRLASHHIYGSARLGVSGYWGQQYDALWDYRPESKVSDSARLFTQLPWFHYGLNSHGAPKKTSASAYPLKTSAIASHFLGQKQFELTNHLGNVQATVSDKRYVRVNGSDGTRLGYAAGVPAVYDYYPFGMLMKERSSADTVTQVAYITQPVLMPVTTTVDGVFSSGVMPVTVMTNITYGAGTATMNSMSTTAELVKVLGGLAPVKSVTLNVPVSYLAGTPTTIRVFDGVTNVMLTSRAVTGTGNYPLTFTPSATSVEIHIVVKRNSGGFGYVKMITLNGGSYEQETGMTYKPMLVRVDNKINDRYEFGYNGQLKDNEIAGVGNSYNFQYRLFDPRIGRFRSLDPIAQTFPWNSPYAFAENRVIQFVELEGLEIAWPIGGWRLSIPRITLPNVGTIPVQPTLPIPPAIPRIPGGSPALPQSPATPGQPIDLSVPVDWNNPPASPADLDGDWAETTSPKNKTGNYRSFENKNTGEKIRFDKGDPSKPKNTWEGNDHWHRQNTNWKKSIGNANKYLDKNGKPVHKGSEASHIGTGNSLLFKFGQGMKKLGKWIGAGPQLKQYQDAMDEYNKKMEKYNKVYEEYQEKYREYLDAGGQPMS